MLATANDRRKRVALVRAAGSTGSNVVVMVDSFNSSDLFAPGAEGDRELIVAPVVGTTVVAAIHFLYRQGFPRSRKLDYRDRC